MRIQKQTKKGELTMQVVVLAALALIFLIVVLFIMTQKSSLFSKGLSSCENKAGICVASETLCKDDNAGTVSSFSCTDESQICCLNTCKGKGGECTLEEDTCGEKEQVYFAGCPSKQICCK